MNQHQAYALLNPPVRFGDAQAIEARDYLEHLARVRQRLMHCKRCDGEGVTRVGNGRRRRLCVCVRLESETLRRDLGVST